MTSTLSLSLVPSFNYLLLSLFRSRYFLRRNAKSWEEVLPGKAMLHTGAEPRIKQRKLWSARIKTVKINSRNCDLRKLMLLGWTFLLPESKGFPLG